MTTHVGPPVQVERAAAPPGFAVAPVMAKILVADDDPRNLFAVEEMLRGPGIEIVLADSGEEVLRHVLKDDFAVILLDVRMPRIDGYELAAMIRARPRSSRIPIIFLTAYNKDELHVFRGYSAGAVDYVFKPIETLILKSKVDVFVDLYRKSEEIRRQGEEERRLLIENLQVRSEKLQAEQELRRALERQEAILRSLPVVVTSRGIEPPFPAIFVSDNVERLTGFPASRFMADAAFGLSRIHPEDQDRVCQELAAAAETGTYTCEYRWRCANEEYRFFLDQGVLSPEESGRTREIFGTMFDVTERRDLEQRLLHASKLEAVGRLTGGIAHDFNNMLSVVIGNLDLLQNSLDGNEKVARRVRLAIEGAQRCADLTNRLLTFSRRQPLQTSIVDLQDLVPGMLELLRRSLGERIDVKLKADDGLWLVEVDAAQLEAALVNLAVNARDAMPDGGSLTVAMANRGADEAGPGGLRGDHVVISVSDTGTGMSAEVKERVFEPFFTTKESGKGTGLGLSMVYGFVRQSDGRIEIDSAPDEGTTIRILLPRAEAVEQHSAAIRSLPVPPRRGDGETILVVEDDDKVRHVTVSTLRSLGFEVIEAENGDEAVAMMGGGGIDLVFSDVKMPGSLSGTDLARKVEKEWPWIKILLTSGYVEAEDDLDRFKIIFKPYRVTELAERIHALLNGPDEAQAQRELRAARIA
ncbi:MAG TPA: response regulator [Beijerinckiaceae bacterium]|jgi:signal transduction histidine kinase